MFLILYNTGFNQNSLKKLVNIHPKLHKNNLIYLEKEKKNFEAIGIQKSVLIYPHPNLIK